MYPPHYLGGYEVTWRSSVRHLRSLGHSVRVLAATFRLAEDRPELDDDVHRELLWYWADHRFPRFSARERLAVERRNAAVYSEHMGGFDPDVVCWWPMGGMSLSAIERTRRAGVPSVGVVGDDWMVYGPKVDAWLRMCARLGPLRPLVERSTGIPTRLELAEGTWLFNSAYTRRRALEAGWDLRDARVAHPGIDPTLFRPQPARPWRWRLLYAGRIERQKGVDLAVDALAHLPAEATLTIVGQADEAYVAELRAAAAQHGAAARVRILPPTRDGLTELYADADAVVFPVRWEEPWGLVPLEAMASGTPVAATGRGGSAEYLEDGMNCVLFDAAMGGQALAIALERLAASQELRAAIREQGLATSARFHEQSYNDEILAALEEAAGKGAA